GLALICLLALSSGLTAQTKPYPPPSEVRAAFLKLLDRPKVPLEPMVKDTKTENGLVVEHLSIASEKKADGSIERVPILIVRPEKPAKKLPAIISLHGTGGNKEGQKALLVQFAQKGFIGVAIDARYHGERSAGGKGAASYVDAITRAWKTKPGEKHEHPF